MYVDEKSCIVAAVGVDVRDGYVWDLSTTAIRSWVYRDRETELTQLSTLRDIYL